VLADGVYGTNAATDVASNMRRSFPSLQFCLLVEIGAGVPSLRNDIRLGDVVVSTPSGRYSGVLPYDMIKSLEGGASQLNGYLCPPPQTLMCAISKLESDPTLSSTPLDDYLKHIQKFKPLQYEHPGTSSDLLFISEYIHPEDHATCHRCDTRYLAKRTARPSQQPRIFYGLIASGNRLMRSAYERDKLGKEHNVLCFEMEGAGIMNSFPCLIIRGICDYADSHKNKNWQNYASASAAAYAKLLLSRLMKMDNFNASPTIPSVEDRGLSRKRLRSPADDVYQHFGKRTAS
jgi:nucleoside phosphorylase